MVELLTMLFEVTMHLAVFYLKLGIQAEFLDETNIDDVLVALMNMAAQVERRNLEVLRKTYTPTRVYRQVASLVGLQMVTSFIGVAKMLELAAKVLPEKRGTYLPAASYTMSKIKKTKFCQCLHGIKVPSGYSANIKKLVSMKELKLYEGQELAAKKHNKLFSHWLKEKARSTLPNVDKPVEELGFGLYVLSSMKVKTLIENNTKDSYYGVIEEIWELDYNSFVIPLFKCIDNVVDEDEYDQYNELPLFSTGCTPTRVYRQVASLVGLQMVTSFIGVAKMLGTQRQTIQRQLTAKKKTSDGPHIESLNKRLSETHEKITMIEEMMRKIFTRLFVHRYQDIDPDIRMSCIQSLRALIVSYPSLFLQDLYLKHQLVPDDALGSLYDLLIDDLPKIRHAIGALVCDHVIAQKFTSLQPRSLGDEDDRSRIHLLRMLQILREFSTDQVLSLYLIDDIWEFMDAMQGMFGTSRSWSGSLERVIRAGCWSKLLKLIFTC
uniref:Sister-chromatid cohesion protein 3 n=1 Tax=Tanacetum cinerariifolium TaxID=118510 RepID=A0A6L2NNW2_TANCI|nr:sister-chromatid cohesion protein 3 [Tanacetum cinerariifolium]